MQAQQQIATKDTAAALTDSENRTGIRSQQSTQPRATVTRLTSANIQELDSRALPRIISHERAVQEAIMRTG